MKNIHVFAADANPSVDPPKFHATQFDAASRVELGAAYWLSEKAIQLCALGRSEMDRRNLIGGGTMRESWHIAPSDKMPVWQMYRTNERRA